MNRVFMGIATARPGKRNSKFRPIALFSSLISRNFATAFLIGLASVALLPSAFAQISIDDLHDGKRFTPGQSNPPAVASRRLIQVRWPARPNVNSFSPPSTAPTGSSGAVAAGYVWDALKRTPTNGDFLWYFTPGSSHDGVTAYEDADWDYNTTYYYSLVGMSYSWYATSNGSGGYYWQLGGSAWESTPVPVTVRRIAATAAQTVDTRIDPRYSTYVLKDFKFGSDKYRGGLFAGFNADGAKVARTYLKFTGLAGPPVIGQQLWAAGGLSLYLTRTAQANQPASVRSRFVSNDTWTPETLVWSNAPTFKSSGEEAVSLSWATGTAGRWVTLNILPDLEQTLTQNGGDGTLSVALSVPNESNGGTSATFPLQAASGWAYFARNGYEQDGLTDIQPYLLYAYGGVGVDITGVSVTIPIPPVTMPPTPQKLYSNQSTNGSVSLVAPAPPGGVMVALSSNAAYVTVPASVTVAAGQTIASFSVTSGTIPTSGNVTISATLGKTVTTSVPVAP